MYTGMFPPPTIAENKVIKIPPVSVPEQVGGTSFGMKILFKTSI